MTAVKGRKRRNVHPEIATARARLASLNARRADPAAIESARADLEAAKADAAVRGFLGLPSGVRERLARLLMSGGGANAA